MKYTITAILLLFLAIPSLSEIKEFDSDKVLVDTDTGQVIFIPRDIDYKYGIDSKSVKYDKKPSLKEAIFGRKGCGK